MAGLEVVTPWHWLALGGALLIIETIAPGFMLMWLGGAAALVGLAMFLWPGLALTSQLLIFALLALASIFGWRYLRRTGVVLSDRPDLNRRAAQFVGRRGVLVNPIVNGHGRIKLGDSSWAVRGPDLPAGQTVLVTGAEGIVLEVELLPEALPAATPTAGAETADPAAERTPSG